MKPDNVIQLDQAIVLKAALDYAKRGWHVIPCYRPVMREIEGVERLVCGCGKLDCSSPGKHPHGFLVPRGQMQATTDEATIRSWFSRGYPLNLAIQMSMSGMVLFDIDPRNGGFVTLESIEAKYGKLFSGIEQFTGGGGLHYFYSNPNGVAGLPGKLGPGFDVKANGYAMVWPSLHISGGLWEFEGSSDPLEGATPSPLPDWIRDFTRHSASVEMPVIGERITDDQQIEDLRSALAFIHPLADDYHTWINVGQALKAIGAVGFELWDTWSQASVKYRAEAQGPKWRSFKPGAFQIESVFHLAQESGWLNPGKCTEPDPQPVEMVALYQAPVLPSAPCNSELPGILADVVQWIDATARKPQPDFSIQAALAFVSVVAGRRYRTTHNNFPSLYFLNIGKSASGKEHAKWAVETLLEACGLPHLIGPAGYTSDSGVLSTLHAQPAHIGIIDEFGKVLEGASIKHGARAVSALKALMEAWGRCHGVMRPQGYSTFGMSQSDADKMLKRTVRHPALTLLAMTTPETLYDAIGSAAARDGFLNRFLIVETDIGRQVGRMVRDIPVPASIIDWAARRTARNGLVDTHSPDLSPEFHTIDFAPAATMAFNAFESECVELMDDNELHGLSEMFGRSNEIAMRVSLIHAVAAEADTISGTMAHQAIQYVKAHTLRAVERLKTAVSDSEFEALNNQVLDLIRQAGSHGLTERELNQRSRKFRGVDLKGKQAVLNTLAYTGDIQQVEIPTVANRGKKRKAWVAIDG